MTTLLNDAVKKPWYRQFWPWFIMALPAAAVVAGLTTVAIAYKNKDSVVRDDWYDEGKSINQDFARDDRAKAMGLSARFQ
ncbi:MAG TPA: FixH family protein, partial [Moraxellaceae bacterium]|nr:FixH family protein [Moraxellaceae bacterium]